MAPSAPLLDGIRVLDLTQFLSGPFGSQILADLGADVLKVEPPAGDSSRTIPPHFANGDSLYFHSINRSKQSIQINLGNDAGRAVFFDLVRTADVVFDNYRPGVLQRLGIDHAALKEINPRIVSCSITGFGDYGPYRDRPAYDAIVQAMSGGMSMTGHPGAPPARMGIPIGDLAAGMYAATAIAAALLRVQRTGEGDHLEVAMLDCQVAMLTYQAAYFLEAGTVPGPQGSGHVSIPTYRTFRCSDDRYVMVTANTEPMWRGLCAALDLPELAEDPRFADAAARLANQEALWSRLEPAFAGFTAVETRDRLVAAGVPAALIHDVAEALGDPNTAARDMVVELTADNGRTIRVAGNPIKSYRGGCRKPEDFAFPPRPGADSATVLTELLRYSPATVAQLKNANAVGAFVPAGTPPQRTLPD